MDNFGLIQQNKGINQWEYKGWTPLGADITNPQFWARFLPLVEKQIINGIETYWCVPFSWLNAIEILLNHKTGIQRNFNDQYSALFANIRNGVGTTYEEFYEGLKYAGLIDQNRLETKGNSWEELNDKKIITPELLKEGQKFFEEWDIEREYVNPSNANDIYEALGGSPLIVTVKYASGDSILNPEGRHNHSVIIYDAKYGEYWLIFDHYTQSIKRYAWKYKFGAIVKPSLIQKDKIMFIPINNLLYLLVEGKEQKLAMGIDGKLMIFTDKVDAIINSASRSKQYQIPKPINRAMWDKVDKVNGKGEIIEKAI
ncbi:MAG: hypothetical protein V1779_17670 [bacterium]